MFGHKTCNEFRPQLHLTEDACLSQQAGLQEEKFEPFSNDPTARSFGKIIAFKAHPKLADDSESSLSGQDLEMLEAQQCKSGMITPFDTEERS